MEQKKMNLTYIITTLVGLFFIVIGNVYSQGQGPFDLRPINPKLSFVSISVTGKIIVDSAAQRGTRYYLDTNNIGTKDYALSFGPPWYSPSNGAQRPLNGATVTIEGDVFNDINLPLIMVTKINGLVWRDTVGIRLIHNPVCDDTLHLNDNHLGNHFGWNPLDSLVTVSVFGKVTIDTIFRHDTIYYLDINSDGKTDYILDFGPRWYQPTSGATRPKNGQTVSITGGLLLRYGKNDTLKFIIVYKINGLTWIDSVGKFPWPGKTIPNGHNSLTRVNSIYNPNTYCSYESNSFMGLTNRTVSNLYSSITEINPVYLPVDNSVNIISSFSINVLDDNENGFFSQFDKNVTINLNYNQKEISQAGVENKNLKLILLLDGKTTAEVVNAKFNYTDNTVSFTNYFPSGIYAIQSSSQAVLSTEPQVTPQQFSLGQNYPNPFNPSTKISFSLPSKSNVRLKIYSLLGNEVRELVNNNFEAGSYNIVWDGKDNMGKSVASGIYLYKLQSDFGTMTKKMNLLK